MTRWSHRQVQDVSNVVRPLNITKERKKIAMPCNVNQFQQSYIMKYTKSGDELDKQFFQVYCFAQECCCCCCCVNLCQSLSESLSSSEEMVSKSSLATTTGACLNAHCCGVQVFGRFLLKPFLCSLTCRGKNNK